MANPDRKYIRVQVDQFIVGAYGLRTTIVRALLEDNYEVVIIPIKDDRGHVMQEQLIVYALEEIHIPKMNDNKYA